MSSTLKSSSRRCQVHLPFISSRILLGLAVLATLLMTLVWVQWQTAGSSLIPTDQLFGSGAGSGIGSEELPANATETTENPPVTKEEPEVDLKQDSINVNWTEFAYVQYATEIDYLCNSLMLFEQMHNLEIKPEKVLLYPKEWGVPEEGPLPAYNVTEGPNELYLIQKARDEFGVKLKPTKVIRLTSHQEYWAASFTKLQIFNMTEYKRILVMDSDSTLHQSLDHLFLSPPAIVAAPRAYWSKPVRGDRILLTSLLMLIQPSKEQAERVVQAMEARGGDDYDMEIVNDLFKDDCLVLPHRGLAFLSGDLRVQSHSQYMGSWTDPWNVTEEMNRTALVHFSDYPYPKVSEQRNYNACTNCRSLGPTSTMMIGKKCSPRAGTATVLKEKLGVICTSHLNDADW